VASVPPEPPRLKPEDFDLLRQIVNEHSGILLSNEMRVTVERKLQERVVALGLPGFREYCMYLRMHPQRKSETERAVDLVTTNETYFFREASQLRACAQAFGDLERRLLHRRRGLHARDPGVALAALHWVGRAHRG
jgi:chemotaxis protein methyltransferase CheR